MKSKTDRDQRLVAFKRAHPDMTWAAIGRIFHISRARVWQIVKATSGDGK